MPPPMPRPTRPPTRRPTPARTLNPRRPLATASRTRPRTAVRPDPPPAALIAGAPWSVPPSLPPLAVSSFWQRRCSGCRRDGRIGSGVRLAVIDVPHLLQARRRRIAGDDLLVDRDCVRHALLVVREVRALTNQGHGLLQRGVAPVLELVGQHDDVAPHLTPGPTPKPHPSPHL